MMSKKQLRNSNIVIAIAIAIAISNSIAINFNYEVHMVHSQKDENMYENQRTNYKLCEKVNK